MAFANRLNQTHGQISPDCYNSRRLAGSLSMGKDEKELSDVVIVLVEEIGMTIHDAARKLTEVGLIVSEVDEEEAIVEGTIETEKVGGLKEMVFVKYVRNV